MRGATHDRMGNMLSDIFQSTRPVRGATPALVSAVTLKAFQSTRPVRGATDNSDDLGGFVIISIHAPRAGRDIANNATG